MILINLLPREYRVEKRGIVLLLRDKRWVRGASLFFGILTLIFYLQYQFNLRSLGKLKAEWLSLEKDVQRITQLKKEIDEGSKKEKEFLQRSVTSPFPTTSILSSVSSYLPNSIWLLELKITRGAKENTLLLKGLSLPSPSHSSIQDIEKYLQELKDKFLSKPEVILTTSRQVKENRELTLFTVVFRWS